MSSYEDGADGAEGANLIPPVATGGAAWDASEPAKLNLKADPVFSTDVSALLVRENEGIAAGGAMFVIGRIEAFGCIQTFGGGAGVAATGAVGRPGAPLKTFEEAGRGRGAVRMV